MNSRSSHRHVSATEARVKFGELMESVKSNNEIVVVQKAGLEMVAIVPVDRLKSLEPSYLDEAWWNRQDDLAKEFQRRSAGEALSDVKDLINVGREAD